MLVASPLESRVRFAIESAVKVTRFPHDPGPAGWNALLPAPPPARVLDEAITADWLVIGAGFAGLSAAYRLSQLRPMDRIVLLEAVRIGEGPAGRNSGFMIDLPHDLASDQYSGALARDQAQTADNRIGIDLAREMAEAYGLSAEAFEQSGKVSGAASARGAAHIADYARHLRAMGEPFEVLDAQDMREMTGGTYYRGGLFTPKAAMIQPALYVREIADGLRQRGVEIFENSPVEEFVRQGSDWVAKSPRGQVTAPQVILAVNGHLESFGHMAGRLMHVFTYASMTRALSADERAQMGGRAIWGLTSADPMGTTVRRINGAFGARIVVRNRFTYDPKMRVGRNRIERVALDHDRAFAARFPMLSGVAMEYRWGGRLCLSRNNVQVIRGLDDGLWSACVQNGLGTAKGTFAGKMAAEAAVGVTSDALERALGEDMPAKLPPKSLTALGAGLRLRWGEWRAGSEK